MGTVTFDGATRVNAADSGTGWGNLGGGGPSPASEAQLRYQGTGAVNRKVTSTGSRTGVEYSGGSVNMTAAANRLFFAKVYVADFGDVNTTYGVEVRVGSGSGAYYSYCVAGSAANRAVFDEYPAQGGYLLVAINPSISSWREGTTGSPSLTGVGYYGVAVQFVAGGAKSENVAMDAIDLGRGLIVTGASSTFIDFLDTDQGNTSNRWGVVSGVAPVVNCRGLLTIGSATATTFDDSTSTVVFLDGYHGPGDVGTLADLQNASTDVTIGATLLGLGSSTTSDTRPDFTVSGTSGVLLFNGTMTNHRNVVLTSASTVDGAVIECADLTQGTAEITNTTVITTSATGVATLNDATFGTTTDLHDMTFQQGGAGHAIELTSTGTYNFTGLEFSGYGADASNAAAVYNNSGGAVTINIGGGGNTPTVRDGSGASTTVNNAVTVKVTVIDEAGDPLSGARVLLEAAAGGDLSAGTDIITGTTDVNGVIENAGFNYTNPQPVTGRARLSSSPGPYYKTGSIVGTINAAGLDTTVQLLLDE